MIILPHDHVLARLPDTVAGFNFSPQVGDDGHVDDHNRLSGVMFDVPHGDLALAAMHKDSESGWMINDSFGLDPSGNRSATFSDVREFVERPGCIAIAAMESAAADGVTDWTEDSEALDGLAINVYAAGVVGLTHMTVLMAQHVTTLTGEVMALKNA